VPRLAGLRYWTASLLPALVGTTLPFWLRPPGFSFRWAGELEFALATALMHSGFCFLQARHLSGRWFARVRGSLAANGDPAWGRRPG
jgi:hypothetical protein